VIVTAGVENGNADHQRCGEVPATRVSEGKGCDTVPAPVLEAGTIPARLSSDVFGAAPQLRRRRSQGGRTRA
jgi:hypothetical protein